MLTDVLLPVYVALEALDILIAALYYCTYGTTKRTFWIHEPLVVYDSDHGCKTQAPHATIMNPSQ